MSKTLTEQAHLFATTGTTLITDGDPLHSRVMKDFPRMLNNLWAYCDTAVGYCQAPNAAGLISADLSTNNTTTEVYVAQCGTIVPRGSVRLVFTVGAAARGSSSPVTGTWTTTVDSVNVYLSSIPFTGTTSPTAFNATLLSDDRCSATVSVTTTATGSTSAYKFGSNTTGATPITVNVGQDGNPVAYVVVTATGRGNTASTGLNQVYLYDFNWWFLKE